MAKISFLLDLDLGHFYPTLGLAQRLKNEGHEIFYLGINDLQSEVEKNGFTLYPIFQESYPPGFVSHYAQLLKEKPELFRKNMVPRPHLGTIVRGTLDGALNEINPDLLIVVFSLSIEIALIQHKYPWLNIAVFMTWLRKSDYNLSNHALNTFLKLPIEQQVEMIDVFESSSANGLKVFFKIIDKIPELIPCPKEFDLPDVHYGKEVYHLDSSIRAATKENTFIKKMAIPQGKKIIYASLGSQAVLSVEQALKVYGYLYEIMLQPESSNWFMVLVINKEITAPGIDSIAGSLQILSWAPQIEMLNHAHLAITHGGLGTIKECIHAEVPMIALPMRYDQFDNANRLAYHKLGLFEDPATINQGKLYSMMKNVLETPQFYARVKEMKRLFEAKVAEKISAQIIHQLITKPVS